MTVVETSGSSGRAATEDLWKQVYISGTEWNELDQLYKLKWDFSNLEKSFEDGGLLHEKKVYLFGFTEIQGIVLNGDLRFIHMPVMAAVVSPCPPTDKVALVPVPPCCGEDIIPMKQMYLEWVPYKYAQGDMKESKVFILRCSQRRDHQNELSSEEVQKYGSCYLYFPQRPRKKESLDKIFFASVRICFPGQRRSINPRFNWKLGRLDEFTNQRIQVGDISEDQKEAYQEFVTHKVEEAKRIKREKKMANRKYIEEMGEETYNSIKLYKFYPVETEDSPGMSWVKRSNSMCKYFGQSHEVL